jgi:2,3-bisphosphoglycerate-dependent phosphoglycerate mutase
LTLLTRVGVRRFVFVRHGESEFNAANRFTGWIDSPLSSTGIAEAKRAGQLLSAQGFRFTRIYSSVLVRCTESAKIIRSALGYPGVPLITSWRLNERHYGALQGLNKAETIARFGEQQVWLWRRSYDVRPPAADPGVRDDLMRDQRYAALRPEQIPLAESLEDTVLRVLPYWTEEIIPAIKSGAFVLIVAHGNSIRALLKYVERLSDAAVADLNIPTGIPEICELDDDMHAANRYALT